MSLCVGGQLGMQESHKTDCNVSFRFLSLVRFGLSLSMVLASLSHFCDVDCGPSSFGAFLLSPLHGKQSFHFIHYRG